MQFTKPFKDKIRRGDVTLSFRVWKRPGARVGGRYNLHPRGAIEVLEVSQVLLARVSRQDAQAAGFADRQALAAFLEVPDDTRVYRVAFRYLGDDLVKQPDTQRGAQAEIDALIDKLTAMDARSARPWTRAVLETIADQPGVRAGDLAGAFGWDTATFKTQVRKLKAKGLTLSLETGYRLSDKGSQLLKALQATG